MRVDFLDKMGDDDAVLNAARISFSKAAEHYTPAQNAKLIHYLARHNHWTPFTHVIFKFRFTAPVAIHAQCINHQIGFAMNTESCRYISDELDYHFPTFRTKLEGDVKQNSLGHHVRNELWQIDYLTQVREAISIYNAMIEDGVAPEQARFILPQGVYTKWILTGSLVAWAQFYKQRSDSCAQYEIQRLAAQVHHEIRRRCPISWTALMEN